jgi:hypothetical protein
MYTFYIGQYLETGLPPLTMIEKCSKIKFEKNLNELLEILPYGMDVYVKDVDGIIYGYHRELKNNMGLLK